MDEEKPNLRPTKRASAHGKSLYLHYNPNRLDNQSSIYAIGTDAEPQPSASAFDEHDPFCIQQPKLHYSLNKQQRWELLDDFRDYLNRRSSSSSLDSEMQTHSDPEQERTGRRSSAGRAEAQPTIYRLREYYNVNHSRNLLAVTTNAGQQPARTRRAVNRTENDAEDSEERAPNSPVNITYVTVVPPPRESCLDQIRRDRGRKNQRVRTGVHNLNLNAKEKQADDLDESDDEHEDASTDDESSYYTTIPSAKAQLNDFITARPAADVRKAPIKRMYSNTDKNHHGKSKNKLFYRQISKEPQSPNAPTTAPTKPLQASQPVNHLMSLAFCPVHLHQPVFTVEHLTTTFGKDFIQAACYPTTYVIRLTKRLKLLFETTDPDFIPLSQLLECYLIVILDDQSDANGTVRRAQVAVNMDLNTETAQIDNLSSTVYELEELITQTLRFVARLPSKKFKPIDFNIYNRRFLKHERDNELSDSEFVNKTIRHVRTLAGKEPCKDAPDVEPIVEESHTVRPEICTSCCSDMDESTPMTAVKSCGHWLCNECWQQYLQTAVKQNKVILCPEWNCSSIIDVGTMLSLVNVRCVNIYERNLERCLVNLSRSHVTCPIKACSKIVQVVGSRIDHVRCRCGHQFCPECKHEPHFPATCSSYQAYVEEATRNGDFTLRKDTGVLVQGLMCVSCDKFIEKNGGCNHMTCRCGAEFCWLCTAYWADHYKGGAFLCPKPQIGLQRRFIHRERNAARKLYDYAIQHRRERAYENQTKQMEACKRLVGTIPLDKQGPFDPELITSQITKREALLRHCFEMVKYITYLHRVCEFVAVAGDGYANNPIEFANTLTPLATIVFNLTQILETGRGYKAIEQLGELHRVSEKIIERLREARRPNSNGYSTP